jgi:hypothetical protein
MAPFEQYLLAERNAEIALAPEFQKRKSSSTVTTPGCVFLHQDAREGLEHRRDPIRSRPFICQQFSVRKKWVEDLTSIRLSCSFLPRIPPYIEKGRVYQKVPKTPLTPIDSVYTARLCRLRMRGPCLAFSAD